MRERRAAMPMLAAHLLRRPVILAANVSGVLCGALVIELTAFLPPMVQGELGLSALAAGFVLGLMTVSWTTASLGLGRILVRLPLRRVAMAAAAALVLGSVLLWWSAGMTLLLVACVPLGFGLGASSLTFTVAIQNAVTTADRGRANSLFYFSRLLGQAVGAAALGGVLNAGLSAGGPGTQGALHDLMGEAGRASLPPGELDRLLPVLASALHSVFACGLVIAILTILVALIVPRVQSEPQAAVIKA